MWSLWCPLLLGVGSAWCRRTGDALISAQQYYLLALLLKVLLVWMTIFLTLGSVGCRVENEYTISVGSNLTNAVLTFCVYFFKEMKCRVWCILHMFFWKVNLRTFLYTTYFITNTIPSTLIFFLSFFLKYSTWNGHNELSCLKHTLGFRHDAFPLRPALRSPVRWNVTWRPTRAITVSGSCMWILHFSIK